MKLDLVHFNKTFFVYYLLASKFIFCAVRSLQPEGEGKSSNSTCQNQNFEAVRYNITSFGPFFVTF